MITDIRTRAKTFLEELGIPVTAFARRVELSESSVRHWIGGYYVLSQKNLDRIDAYLSKYGF